MSKELLLGLLLGLVAYAQVVGWHPPWAILVWASPINATHFQTTYNGLNAYIVQDGLGFQGTREENFAAQQLLSQICRYVAVDVKNVTIDEYSAYMTADIYCSPDGIRWAYLKWLSLRVKAYQANVTLVMVNLTASTPLGNFSGQLPEGWYADLNSRYTFHVPGDNFSVVEWYYAQAEKYRLTIASLQSELENKTATLSALEGRVKGLQDELKAREGQIGDLQRQLQACNAQLKNATAERRRLEGLLQKAKDDLERLSAELNSTKSKVQSYEAQIQSLVAQLQEKSREANGFSLPPYIIAAVALIAIGVGYIVYKKRYQ